AEIEEMLNENLTKLQRVIVELLYGCGLRVSELANLKLNNFDMSAKYLKTLGKGSKERIVPLGSKAINAIKIFRVF
ncbi:MAG: tyrosine-type recombinase/integrase, partial [Desulfovibrionaceae bacterium]